MIIKPSTTNNFPSVPNLTNIWGTSLITSTFLVKHVFCSIINEYLSNGPTGRAISKPLYREFG